MCDFRALSIVDVDIVTYYHEIGAELRIMNFNLQFSLASVFMFFFIFFIMHLLNFTSHFDKMMHLVLFIEKEILYVLLIFLCLYF